nr:ribonuclease H-like domain-containing protein [Tanacetum cinerariifolium]
MATRSQSGIVKPIERLSLHTSSVSPILKSPFLSLKDSKWCSAMYDEYNALVKNGTWILVPRQSDANMVPSMWLFKHKSHVDDTLSRYKARLVANVLLQHIVDSLHNEFDMTDLGALNYFLGISVVRHPTGLFLSQKKYALQLLERAHMANCNPSQTPVDTDSKLSPDGVPVQDPTLYRSLAKGLQYLTFTRLDLSYAVQQVCLYMHDPREPYFTALKRILRYVQGTLELGLHLYAFATTSLVGYTDADWAETAWIRNLLRELHSPLLKATLVYCDNLLFMALGGSDQNAENALSKLLQIGTVAEYQNEFEILINQVTVISLSLLKSLYISELKLELQRELLRSRPTTLGEAFSLACIVEARYEDKQPTVAITKPNDLTARAQVQDLEQTTQGRGDEPNRILLVTIHHMIYPITVEVLHQVFSSHGYVEKVIIFQKLVGVQALIQFQSRHNVITARNSKQGSDNTKPPLFVDTFGNNGGDDLKSSGPVTPAKEVVDGGHSSTLSSLVEHERERMRLQAMVTGRSYQGFEGSPQEATWEWMSDSHQHILYITLRVTAIEESKDLSSLALDELIENLKVHKVVMEKDFKIYKGKKERIKSIALKAKKESSDDETLTFGCDDEEYAMAVRNFNKFFRRKGKFVRQPREERKSL